MVELIGFNVVLFFILELKKLYLNKFHFKYSDEFKGKLL